MRINTDLVKNKKYTTPIKSSALKHSQEYRVLATLRYLYPEKFDTMIAGEAPDLQDHANGLGIEVTVAVNENDMRASRAFSELYQGKLKDIERRKKVIESSGYSFIPRNDEKIAIATLGTADGEKHFFKKVCGEKRRNSRSTEQITRRLVWRYYYLRYQPLMRKHTLLNGFLNVWKRQTTCLISFM